MSPPGYPPAWLRLRSAASFSPGKIIVAPQRDRHCQQVVCSSFGITSDNCLSLLSGEEK
jgi:hypothetical protein